MKYTTSFFQILSFKLVSGRTKWKRAYYDKSALERSRIIITSVHKSMHHKYHDQNDIFQTIYSEILPYTLPILMQSNWTLSESTLHSFIYVTL